MANFNNGADFLLCMWFHKDLRKQIRDIIRSIERDELTIPDTWQWMEQREHKLEHIEDEDIVLIKELQDLHRRGLDIPELSLRIITKSLQLKDYIKAMESQWGLDPKTQKEEAKRLKDFTKEIELLFQQELEAIKESQEAAVHEGRGKAVPKKCIAFFSAEANKAEQAEQDFNKFLSAVGKDPTALYRYLRKRFSGYAWDLEKQIKDKVKNELQIAEKLGKKVNNVVYKSGAGWNHFIINGDSQQHRSFKSYITLDYTTFSGNAFALALETLAKSGFRGQMKLAEPSAYYSFFRQDDNIVIHGDEPHLVTRATQLVMAVLQKEGVRIGGGSRSSKFNIAQDFMVPDLSALGKKAHKTSFSDGIAEIACEILLQAINGSRQYLNSYTDFRKLLVKLYADNGHFVQYVKSIGISL